MGEVHRAWDERLERAVAVKVLRRSGAGEAERILLEARLQARVEHPHVVKVHEVGTLDGRPCVVLQMVEGGFDGEARAGPPGRGAGGAAAAGGDGPARGPPAGARAPRREAGQRARRRGSRRRAARAHERLRPGQGRGGRPLPERPRPGDARLHEPGADRRAGPGRPPLRRVRARGFPLRLAGRAPALPPRAGRWGRPGPGRDACDPPDPGGGPAEPRARGARPSARPLPDRGPGHGEGSEPTATRRPKPSPRTSDAGSEERPSGRSGPGGWSGRSSGPGGTGPCRGHWGWWPWPSSSPAAGRS